MSEIEPSGSSGSFGSPASMAGDVERRWKSWPVALRNSGGRAMFVVGALPKM